MADGIRVDVRGAKELAALLKRASVKTPAETRALVQEAAFDIQSEAVALAPVNKQVGWGGRLRTSIHVMHEMAGPDAVASEAYTNVEYAPYVEYDTKPHVIMPKTKRVLAWRTGRTWHFARRVQHPGTKAQPYMRPAAEKVFPGLIRDLRAMLRRLGKGGA